MQTKRQSWCIEDIAGLAIFYAREQGNISLAKLSHRMAAQ